MSEWLRNGNEETKYKRANTIGAKGTGEKRKKGVKKKSANKKKLYITR